MTQYIKAPFNFVPVSEKVFFPDWANQISHDIPFQDGESGVLELTITAQSPIFVRNGHTKKEAEDKTDEYKSFSKMGKNDYFIPATSIKGAIRNVMEIMSFGKMRIDQQMKFSTREWDNPKLYNLKETQSTINCGWLTIKETGYQIDDCGIPFRINHKRIDEILEDKGKDAKFENYFSKNSGFDLNKEIEIDGKKFDPKTAVFKYSLIKNDLKLLSNHFFEVDEVFCTEHQERRMKVSNDETELSGTIVFTGSPDSWIFPRKPKGGKFYEFVFPKHEGETHKISDEVFNYFKFIYSDSEDWKFWKDKVENGEKMPVFFRLEHLGDKVKVKDFGLAFLYKLPFEKSPYELLSVNHKQIEDPTKPFKPDLPECILGYTSKKSSLKGRVHFSHAFIEGVAKVKSEVELLLGSPKPSYYPIYVKQEGENGKVTEYNVYSTGKQIAGWKRYPIRSKVWNNKSDDNPDLNTHFIPLSEGSVFKSYVRFHNLRKDEIGALLSAMTFHNNGGFFHQIGLAKPYGYGKVSITVSLNSVLKFSNQEEYMAAFEEVIVNDKNNFKGKVHWHDSVQLSHLFTMASDSDSKMDELLEYMHLDTDREKNDFLKAKEFKEYLDRYTSLSNEMKNPVSVYKSIKEQKENEVLVRSIEAENAKKEAILKAVEETKQKEDAERQKRKDAKQLEATTRGFISAITDYSKRDTWDQLKKEVDRFVCIIQKDNNYDRILKNSVDGVLLVEYHEQVLDCVLKTFVASREKAKWETPFDKNPFLKKVTEWVGSEHALKFFNDLCK
jgi:CRISPR-associated protein (TIGR03986 family)